MGDHRAAGRAAGRDEIRRVVIDFRVQQDRHRDAETLATFENPEGADAIAVIAPGRVGQVRQARDDDGRNPLGRHRRE